MASVRVESEVHTDPRYPKLGKLIGGCSLTAIGAMTRVWRHMQERYSPDLGEAAYTTDDQTIAALFEGRKWAQRFGDHVCTVGLGERLDDRSIRVCGAVGRIEWLWKKRVNARNNGARGGRPPKPTSVSSGLSMGFPMETPPAPAPAPAPSSLRSEEELSLASLAPRKPAGFREARERSAYPAWFDALWAVCPKGSKREAFRAAAALDKSGDLPTVVVLETVWAAQVDALDDPKYQPDTCRWLKRRGWEDAPRVTNGRRPEEIDPWANPIKAPPKPPGVA